MFLPHPRVKVSIVGSLRDREVACSASDRQGSNFESCVWRTVSSQSSHHPQEVLLAQFSLYVHKGGLKPDSFHFIWGRRYVLADWHPNRWRTSRKYSRFITYPCRMGQTLQINCFGLGQLLNNLRHNCLLTLKINPYTAKARPHSRF